MWLIDNNVPRAVTRAIRDLGGDVEEVRDVLGQAASDNEISAYAMAKGRCVITHDMRFARACLASGLPHVWIRCRESEDRDAIRHHWAGIEGCLDAGAVRVIVTTGGIECVGGTDGRV